MSWLINPMPTYTDYPSGADLESMLTEAGFESCGVDLEASIEEAISWWEIETGYKPFLQGSSASYFYDPPGPNQKGLNKGGGKELFLARGFTAVTAVATGITPEDAVGTVLTVGTHYRLKPYNAAADNVPYTKIEFTYPVWGLAASIKVTGTPGYAAEIPASAYRGILKMAGAETLRSLRESMSISPTEWKEDDVTERLSIENVGKLGNTWTADAKKAVEMYRLWSR